MKNRGTENYLVKALDDRIRICVEQVLSEMLTRQFQSARGDTLVARANGNGTARRTSLQRVGRPRGRPRKARSIEIQGKVLRTLRTPRGSVVFTSNEKYLRRPNGLIIKLSRVKGSQEPARAMGYSSSEYQLARRYRWPMPCPMDFQPPARRGRGRPAKVARA